MDGTYLLPEDGQELWLKHVGARIKDKYKLEYCINLTLLYG